MLQLLLPPFVHEIEAELERRLIRHDWFYEMSDDGRAYGRGFNDHADIRALVVALNVHRPGRGTELYNSYKPRIAV